MKLNIKPLSVNQVWQGKRYKTKTYKYYENALLNLLPKNYEIPRGKLKIIITFGFSTPNSDWDNPIKPFQDILQKKYGFNDNKVYKAIVVKEIVKKGQEFIKFEIKKYNK